MGVNKVIYYGEVLVDMSQVTVTPETLGKGVTALDAKGDLITGTHECAKTEPKLQSKTVTPTTNVQTVNPDSGYDGLSKVTVNAMPTATQATPSITVSSGGLITAKATQSAGYVSAGTKSATKQLTTQAAQTITPGTSNKTIASGRYLTGTQTIKGDANLVAGNIKSGVSIFGVSGSYEGSGGSGGGSAETCTVTIVHNVNGFFAGGGEELYITATVLGSDGKMTPFFTILSEFGGSIDMSNIVCGTAIVVRPISGFAGSCECTDNILVFRNDHGNSEWVLQPNGDGTITIAD